MLNFPTKEQIEQLYIVENKTRYEVVSILGLDSIDTLRKLLRKYNIRKIKDRSIICEDKLIPYAILYDKYINQNLSLQELSKEYPRGILNKSLKFHNIRKPTQLILEKSKHTTALRYGDSQIFKTNWFKSRSSRTEECKYANKKSTLARRLKNPIYSISREELYDLYIVQNKRRSELTTYFHCSDSTIKKLLKTYKIIKSKDLVSKNSSETNIVKYGGKTPTASNEIRSKIKATCLRKYGVKSNLVLSKRSTRSISKMETAWLKSLNIVTLKAQYKIGNYYVDGFDTATNTIYEFLGDYWHGNLNCYSAQMQNKTVKLTFKELNERTIERFEYFINLGYTVYYVWEQDYYKGNPLKIYKQGTTQI